MKAIVMGGIAAAVLALSGLAGPAQANCMWTGAYWACVPGAAVIAAPAPVVVVHPWVNPAYGRYGWTVWGPEQPNANPGAGTGD